MHGHTNIKHYFPNITADYPFELKHDILCELRTGFYYIQCALISVLRGLNVMTLVNRNSYETSLICLCNFSTVPVYKTHYTFFFKKQNELRFAFATVEKVQTHTSGVSHVTTLSENYVVRIYAFNRRFPVVIYHRVNNSYWCVKVNVRLSVFMPRRRTGAQRYSSNYS